MADDTTTTPAPDAGGGFGWADALGLAGGLLKTWGNISAQTAYNNALRNVQDKENQLFQKISATQPADVAEGIKANYQGLSATVRNQIVQAVSAEMAGKGITGNTGMFQVALDEAFAKAIIPMMEMAQQAYFQNRSQAIQSLPRTVGPPPGPGGNPFGSLVDIATNKKLLSSIFNQKQPGALPGATDTLTGLTGRSPSLPPDPSVPPDLNTSALTVPLSEDPSSAEYGL